MEEGRGKMGVDGRGKTEEGKTEEGRRKREDGRGKREDGRWKREEWETSIYMTVGKNSHITILFPS